MATINKKYGETYIATATPNTGYRFVRWTGTGVSTTDNPATLTCVGDNTIEAIFERLQYTLNVGVYPATSGTIVFDPQPASENVIRYTSATAATSDWISENTDTTKNTYNSSTGQGVLYVKPGVYALGSPADTASEDAAKPFGSTAITSLDLTDFTYTPTTRSINDPIIGPNAFAGDTSLTSVVIGPNVNWIGDNAFLGCYNLQSVEIQGVVDIGDSAFSGCSSLSIFNITGAVRAIAKEAFQGCRSLISLTFPVGLKYIGYQAFYNCSSLATLNLPEGLEYIDTNFIVGTSIQTMTIPSTVGCIALSQTTVAPVAFPTYIFKSYAPPIFTNVAPIAIQVPSNAVSVWQSYNYGTETNPFASITSSGQTATVTNVPIYEHEGGASPDIDKVYGGYTDYTNPDCENVNLFYGDCNASMPYGGIVGHCLPEEGDDQSFDAVRVTTDRYFNTYSTINYSAEQEYDCSGYAPNYLYKNSTASYNSVVYYMFIRDSLITTRAAYIPDENTLTAYYANHPFTPYEPEPEEYCECCGELLEGGVCVNVCCGCSPYYNPEECGGGGDQETCPVCGDPLDMNTGCCTNQECENYCEPEPEPEEEPEE